MDAVVSWVESMKLKQLVHPYYLVNILLSISYLLCKFVKPACGLVFAGDCELDMRQGEILFFLLVVVMVRARKHGSMTVIAYLNNSFMYAKVANTILWFSSWKPYGFAFAFFFLLQAFLLPEPLYSGPEKVVYFRDESLFKAEVEKKAGTASAWLVEFYTTWNPACVNLAPVFSELSSKYALPNFQFGKVDVGRFPALGHAYGISDSAFSKQLPTLILFRNGVPQLIRPTADSKGKLIKFHMNMENIVTAFDLNNLHSELKAVAATSKKPIQHPKSE